MSIRVVLADDHLPTRAGIRSSLEAHGMTICAEAGDAVAAVYAVRENLPDICLLDVRMPGDGIVAAATICDEIPSTAVVMLSAYQDEDLVFAALKAGAKGYLLKDTDPVRLPIALEAVLSGEAALPRPLVMKLIDEFRLRERRNSLPLPRGGSAKLSEREYEILRLLEKDLKTAEIAEKLRISQVTVRRHISSIVIKLKVKSRSEAVSLLRSTTS